MKYVLLLTLITGMAAPLWADQACAINDLLTQHILNCLKKSSTRYRGSQDWKIYILDKNAQAQTVYAQTHCAKYSGIIAALYGFSHRGNQFHLKEDAVSGQFIVKNDGDFVEVESTITITKITKANDYREIEMLKNLKQNQVTQENDGCTKCAVLVQAIFNEDKMRLEKTTKSRCRTKMSVQKFEQMLSE